MVGIMVLGIFFFRDSCARDTLTVRGELLIDGLEDARSLVFRPDDELVITEASADRIVSFRIVFGDADSEKNAGAISKPDKNDETEEKIDITRVNDKSDVYLPDLQQPGALSIVLDTYFAVISTGSNRVHMLDEEMSYIRSLQVPPWARPDGEFVPTDITSTEIGELFVLDSFQKIVYHFNANGSYLQNVYLGDLEHPTALMYAEESLFVSDSKAGKLVVLTDTGHELATIGTFPGLSRVRVINRMIWIISDEVIHLFDIYGDHVGNWRIDGVAENIRDIALIDNQIFILTTDSLYFLGTLL